MTDSRDIMKALLIDKKILAYWMKLKSEILLKRHKQWSIASVSISAYRELTIYKDGIKYGKRARIFYKSKYHSRHTVCESLAMSSI